MRVFNRFRQLLCNWIKMKFYEKVIDICNYVKEKTPSQAFSCKFCKFLHNNGFWDFLRIILQILGWLLLDLLLLNVLYYWTAYCKRDKIINLTILTSIPCWTHKNFFCNEVTFYFMWLWPCVKSARISLYLVWMRENADQSNSEYGHFYAVLGYKRC